MALDGTILYVLPRRSDESRPARGLKLESETLFSVAEEADPNDERHDEAEREVLRALMAKPLRVSDLRKAVSRPGLLRTLKIWWKPDGSRSKKK